MRWDLVFTFCERLYAKLLREVGFWDDREWAIRETLASVKSDFSEEMNTILSEENISFIFEEGEFRRTGRPQTHKSIARANSILSDPKLEPVRLHYLKAIKYFEAKTPDYPNVVKEAICALELAIEIVTGKKVSKDFSREMTQLAGNDPDQIPSPIIQALIKLYAYRGGAEGVSHGTVQGFRVTQYEAELLLSMVAAQITYIVDYFDSLQPEVPF